MHKGVNTMKRLSLGLSIMLLFILTMIFSLTMSCDKIDSSAAEDSVKNYFTDDMFVEKFQFGMYPDTGYSNPEFSSTDNYLDQMNNNDNYGLSNAALIGLYYNGESTNYLYRYLLKFKIDGYLPENAVISQVYLNLYISPFNFQGAILEEGSSKGIYSLTTPFTEGDGRSGSSWNYSNGKDSWKTKIGGGDYYSTLISDVIDLTGDSTAGYYTFKLDPAVVQSWLTVPEKNHGMIIKNLPEDETTDTKNKYSTVITNQSEEVYKRPMLIIYYKMP